MVRRADIQGLRAFAVLAVVAFHAGLPVRGGFVGVDIFFVISGFVIAGLLARELEMSGRIDFRRFYLRRFKRLAPALALVVVVTAAASALVQSPLGAQQTVGETGLGVIFLVANWVIAGNTGAYFDAPAGTNPLLHTWSLSVEEQFYVLFPALLYLCWRRRRSIPAVGAVAAISFLSALLGAHLLGHSWLFGFYSPVVRAWEFALGALVALASGRLPVRSPRTSSAVSLVGAGLVIASLWLIDSHTPFPGAWTLLPVAGTALLLAAGGHDRNLVSSALGARAAVAIGDWSYSIYLWHWPFIVFATLLWPGSPHAALVAAALSLAPALVSYVRVEQPLRRLELPPRRVALFAAAVIATPLAAAGGMRLAADDFWAPRYESGAMPVAHPGDIGQETFYRSMRRGSYACGAADLRAQALAWKGFRRCRQSRPGRDVAVALIGDSHAEHLFTGLAGDLRVNVGYYIVDDAPVTTDRKFARIVADVASDRSIRTVLLNADWAARGVPGRQLEATLERLSNARKNVFVTDDVPSFTFDPFECKYRQALFRPSECSADSSQFERYYSRYFPELAAAVRLVPHAHLLLTVRYFCGRTRCDMARNGQLLYRDYNHLNLNGSRFVARRLLEDYPAFAAAVHGRSSPGS